MRCAFSTATLRENVSSQPYGVRLAYGLCGEHDFGVAPLAAMLGAPDLAAAGGFEGHYLDELPFPSREGVVLLEQHLGCGPVTIFGVVDPLRLLDDDTPASLIISDIDRAVDDADAFMYRGTGLRPNTELGSRERWTGPWLNTWAAWDRASFAIATRDPELRVILRDLRAALEVDDFAAVYSGNSLDLLIWSRVSEFDRLHIGNAKVDRDALREAAEATGISSNLLASGCLVTCLEPQWRYPEAWTNSQSAYPVEFLVRPLEEEHAQRGVYTVEQLLEWTTGTGPVVGR